MALALPVYANRGEVQRALDLKPAAADNTKVDRALAAGRDSVEQICHRKFYPETKTVYFDWPSYQRAAPWRIWFDGAEIADITVTPPIVTTGGHVIPANQIIWGNPRFAPPYTYLELDRSTTAVFGGAATPQRSVSVTATFGYSLRTAPAGTLTAPTAPTDPTITVTAGSLDAGDLIIVDNERMLVTDTMFTTTGVPFTGPTTASMLDSTLPVPDATKFAAGEVIQLDTERCLILNIAGDTLQLKRAWDGSTLTEHTSGTIYAHRQLSVLRGQLGTPPAAHPQGTPVQVSAPPDLVRQLNIAEAVVALAMEPSGYAQSVGGEGQPAGKTGGGLPDLRARVSAAFGRQGRQRVV